MDLQDNLIESSKKKGKRSWAPVASLVAHAVLIGGILIATAQSTHKADAEDKPIRAFISQGAAPPPPPPPPPPPAGSPAPQPQATPKIAHVQPTPVTPHTFVQPREIPKEVPQLQPMTSASEDDKSDADATPTPPLPTTPGVTGGVTGGVQGGTVGGELGGEKGGVLGGVKGGVVGGELGGKLGGTGTGTEGEGTGGKEADPGPLRVGGDVKAPVAVQRAEPAYTEAARHARIAGVVILEAVINKQGEVEQVRVLKPLPGGLSEKAEEAVKHWRFKPGTQNGQPVDVIFNLTVNFKLDA